MATVQFLRSARVVALSTAASIIAMVWLVGCTKSKRPESAEAPPKDSPAASPATRPLADVDLLNDVPVGAAVTNKELALADQAWTDLMNASRPPEQPSEWETNKPSDQAIAEFRKSAGALFLRTATMAGEFYKKFPKHEKAEEAREREQHFLNLALELGQTNALARLEKLDEERLKDPSLSADERLEVRISQVQRTAFRLAGEDSKGVLKELEKGARALQKEFPKAPEPGGLLLAVAERWLDENDVTKARSLAQEVAGGASVAELKEAADVLSQKIDRLGKPLAIQFTALDGRTVDLQAMKGKVVLVDFWATWCEPCLLELPNVKAAYQKYHDKGFEVVGLSLDHQKEMLEALVEKAQMPWPQFFDESAEGNRFARELHVEKIPAMWLVDKKGNLRDFNGRDDLVGKIEKLLAEK